MASADLAALVSMFDDEDDETEPCVEPFATAPNESPGQLAVVESQPAPPGREFPVSTEDLTRSEPTLQVESRLHLQSIAKSTAEKVQSSTIAGPSVFDPTFGIRVREPKVSSSTFRAYTTDCRKIKLSSLRPASAPDGEWVTMGVIVDKSPYNTSANGNSYMIWRVSDLMNSQQSAVKVLLFGDCLKQHWKLQTGMVVALLQGQWGDSNDNKTVTLKFTKAGQIVEIGFTPDYGICKATKNDGTACSQFVNLSVADKCVFHLQAEANKFSSRRGALSAISVPQSRAWKVNEPPSRMPVKAPAGVTTVSRPQTSKTVIAKPVPLQARARQHVEALSNQQSEERTRLQELIKRKATYNAGARSLIRVKAAERDRTADPKESAKAPPVRPQTSMKQFIQQQMASSTKQSDRNRDVLNELINLNESPEKKPPSGFKPSEELARKRAAAILKRKATDSDAGSSSAKRLKASESDQSLTTRKGQLGGAFTDDQIRSLLEKKSAHEAEARQEDEEREARYFHGKEAEEKVESYLTGTMEIKNCKVVSCKECDYTASHQSNFCKIQGHSVTRHSADKRFFRCADCHTRTIAYALLPTKPCDCGGKNWQRVSMRDERRVEKEKLLVRGEERKFVNA